MSEPTRARSLAPFLALLLVGVSALGGWLWLRHGKTPEQRARERLTEAERLVALGNFTFAAQRFRDLADEDTPHSAAALQAFRQLLGRADTMPLETTLVLYRLAIDWQTRPELAADLPERGCKLLKQRADSDPVRATELYILLQGQTNSPELRLQLEDELGDHLRRWTARDPNDLELAIHYANYLGLPRRQDTVGIVKLLEPHQARLGTGDGARLLGQAYSRLGQTRQGIALLEPYCRQYVPTLLAIEAKLTPTYSAIRKEAETEIAQRSAADFDFVAYDKATEPEKYQLREMYIQARTAKEPSVRELQAQRAEIRLAMAALQDLARLYINRARTQVDPKKRLADLERAEADFLTLRDSEDVRASMKFATDVRFSLALVSLLRGRTEEGRQRLNEVYEAFHHDPGILLGGCSILQDAGELAAARTLADKAYEKTPEQNRPGRQLVAWQRSRMSHDDPNDELTWLGRCDASVPEVRLALVLAQAERDRRQGASDRAVNHFKEAARLFPENGVVRLRQFQVSRDTKDLDEGLALITRAIDTQPGNLAVREFLLAPLTEAVCSDLVFDSIDLRALRRPGSLDHLAFLYSDRAGRAAQAARLSKHPGIDRVRAQLVKLLELPFVQQNPCQLLTALCLLDRDEKQLKELDDRLRDADIDFGLSIFQLSNQFAGQIDPTLKQQRQAQLARWEERVRELRRKTADATLAVALTALGNTLLRGETLGEVVDAERVVQLAEEARQACKCRATSQQLVSALLLRAHQRLCKSEGKYRQMADRVRFALDSAPLIAVALTREEALAKVVAADADVTTACRLLRDYAAAFPDEPSPWLWAMLSRTHPETAATVASGVRSDEVMRLARSIVVRLNPLGLSPALEEFWAAQLNQREQEGQTILRQLAERGVPLPFTVE